MISHTLAVASIAALLACLASAPAMAQLDPWEFEVYPYQTEGKGVVEMESLNGVIANGHSEGGEGTSAGTFPSNHMWNSAFELTYGLTDKLEAAAYLNLSHPDGSGFQYAGSKFRLRGSLFEQGEMPVDLGWYLELEWHQTPQFDGSELEAELKPIIEKDWGRFSLILNPKVEKSVFLGPDKNKGFEFGYVAGLYYRFIRYISPGVEFYGGIGLIDDSDPLDQQQHYIFPVLMGELPGDIEYNLGSGFGLTRGSDRIIVKLNLELERFIGTLL